MNVRNKSITIGDHGIFGRGAYNKTVTKLDVTWCGRLDYQEAWEWQKTLVQARTTDASSPDRLLLLEHPPTFTLGTRGSLEHLLADDDTLAAAGIGVHRVDRGGDITYHGPGQLVAYPILNLERLSRRANIDLHGYVRGLEAVIIAALTTFGIEGRPLPGYTGVWINHGGELVKIAAIGVRVSTKGISSHGFALNVCPDMTHFDYIVPCGIADHSVISLQELLDHPVVVTDLLEPIVEGFHTVFGFTPGQIEPLTLPEKLERVKRK